MNRQRRLRVGDCQSSLEKFLDDFEEFSREQNSGGRRGCLSSRLCRIHRRQISPDKASNGVVVKFDVVPLVLRASRRIMQDPDNRAELTVFLQVAPG